MENPDIQSVNQGNPVNPWTEIPYVPLPTADPTRGGRFLSDAREINIGDGGDNVFRVDRQGMWLGAALFEDAPFSVSMLGEVIAEALTVIGGVITGATVQTSALATTGLKMDSTSFRGYNSSGDQTLTISSATGYINVAGYLASSLVRSISIAPSSAQASISIEDINTAEIGYQWTGPSSGTNTASRQDIPAFYHFNKNCEHGDGFVSKNTYATWDGNHFRVTPNAAKNVQALLIDPSSWSAQPYKSRITAEGLIDFPAFYHYSEFDENPAALASSVIANAYWLGGGTSGTQIIRAEGVDGFPLDLTYLRLSTTPTASRSSSATHRRAVQLGALSRWDALIRVPTTITTLTLKWGWYYDSTHYAYFLFDTSQHATKVYFAYRNGGSETLVDLNLSLPTDGYFHRFSIQIYSGTMLVFYEDILKATISASSPQYGYSYFYVDNKSTAIEHTLDVEYEKHWSGRTLNI